MPSQKHCQHSPVGRQAQLPQGAFSIAGPAAEATDYCCKVWRCSSLEVRWQCMLLLLYLPAGAAGNSRGQRASLTRTARAGCWYCMHHEHKETNVEAWTPPKADSSSQSGSINRYWCTGRGMCGYPEVLSVCWSSCIRWMLLTTSGTC